MAYTAPSNTNVDFSLQSGYSAPANTSVDFQFDKTTNTAKVAPTISQSTVTSGVASPSYTTTPTVTSSVTATSSTDSAKSQKNTGSIPVTVLESAETGPLNLSLNTDILTGKSNVTELEVISITENKFNAYSDKTPVYKKQNKLIEYKKQQKNVKYNND